MCENHCCHSHKSLTISILLTVFFGPIGLLYATFWGAVFMLVLVFVSLFIQQGGGALFMLFWVACSYWGVWEINKHHARCHATKTKIET